MSVHRSLVTDSTSRQSEMLVVTYWDGHLKAISALRVFLNPFHDSPQLFSACAVTVFLDTQIVLFYLLTFSPYLDADGNYTSIGYNFQLLCYCCIGYTSPLVPSGNFTDCANHTDKHATKETERQIDRKTDSKIDVSQTLLLLLQADHNAYFPPFRCRSAVAVSLFRSAVPLYRCCSSVP